MLIAEGDSVVLLERLVGSPVYADMRVFVAAGIPTDSLGARLTYSCRVVCYYL